MLVFIRVWMFRGVLLLTGFDWCAGQGYYEVKRLNQGEPLIDRAMFEAAGIAGDGRNINGPSLIKVPDWIPPEQRADPSANYYLYFANHRGNYIRMAWAPAVEGPYQLFNANPSTPEGQRGVLGLPQPSDELFLRDGEIRLWQEFASPRVFVDHENQRILLFFHTFSGVRRNDGSGTYGMKGQKTHVALSIDGLDFNGQIEPVRLGDFYFDIWEREGRYYAWSNKGYLFQAPAGATLANNGLWTAPAGHDYRDDLWREYQGPIRENHASDPEEAADNPRHFGTRRVGDHLHLFFSRRDDLPESIMLSIIDLGEDGPEQWQASHPPETILAPELEWEGVNYPLEPSENGSATGVRQLRDPFIYEEEGRIYLFYSGAGEEAIGIAELIPRSPVSNIETGLLEVNETMWLACAMNRRLGHPGPWRLKRTGSLQPGEWHEVALDGIEGAMEVLDANIGGEGTHERIRFSVPLSGDSDAHFIRVHYPL